MSDTQTREMVWHNDGHIMHLELHQNEVLITHVTCPGGEASSCQHPQVGCLVDWFLLRFGLECNTGVAPISADMTIAWTVSGDLNLIDECQVWVMPVNDEAFAAWLITQTPSEG